MDWDRGPEELTWERVSIHNDCKEDIIVDSVIVHNHFYVYNNGII